MRKGKDIVGLPVLGYDTGKKLATVKELILDPKQRRVLAFLVDQVSGAEAKVISFRSTRAIGPDALIVQNEQAIVPASEIPEVEAALRARTTIAGMRVFTEDGRNVGTIDDVLFDEATGELKGFEVSRGLLDRMRGAGAILPLTPTTNIGSDVVFVPSEAGAQLEQRAAEYRPGLEEVRTGSEELLRRVRDEAERLLDVTTKASTEQQIRFVIGKVADRPVVAPDNTLIVSQGEVIDENIARDAERKGVLRELVLAAGARVAMDVLRELREGATRAMKTMRWSGRQPEAPEQSETEEAGTNEIIGRRVGRVVLDHDQRVILGAGEMVTHESVERARHAGVLKELNAAAWMEEPHPVGEEKVREEAEMRAEQEEEKKES